MACRLWKEAKEKTDGVFTTKKQEAALWHKSMEAQHGEDWLKDLAAYACGDDSDDEEEEESDRLRGSNSNLQAGNPGELLSPVAAADTAAEADPTRSPVSGISTLLMPT